MEIFADTNFSKKKALLYALGLTLLWRVITSTFLFIAATYYPVYPGPSDPNLTSFYTALLNGNYFEQRFILPWLRWDTYHYISIATDGYVSEKLSVWPPLFPALIALLSTFGLQPLAAALFISTISTVVIVYSLFMLAYEEQIGSPNTVLFYLLTFPVAFYLLSGYSEALFLALSLTSFRQARKGNLLLAGILAALATLTRQMGALLALPLFIEGLRAKSISLKQLSFRPLASAISYSILPILAYLSFTLFVHFGLGFNLPWSNFDLHGQHQIVFPGGGIIMALTNLIEHKDVLNPFTLILDAALTLITISLFVQGALQRERIPVSFLSFIFVNLIVIMMFILEKKPLVSTSRYLLVVFPIFFLQAQLWKTKTIRLIWFTSATTLNFLLLFGFYAGFWIE